MVSSMPLLVTVAISGSALGLQMLIFHNVSHPNKLKSENELVAAVRLFATSVQKRTKKKGFTNANNNNNAQIPKTTTTTTTYPQKITHLVPPALPQPAYKTDKGKNIDPAFLILGLFPIVATGMLVFVKDDLREQVMENWKSPQAKKSNQTNE